MTPKAHSQKLPFARLNIGPQELELSIPARPCLHRSTSNCSTAPG
jgi:hypothetical protein